MAHTFGNASTRGSSATNPVVVSFSPALGSTVLVLMMHYDGATDRTGGTPTWKGSPMAQVSTTQRAAASPELTTEMWYSLAPGVLTGNVSIPNAGSLTIRTVIATGKASAGLTSVLDISAGANNTSTNPSVSVSTTANGDIIFACVGNGAQTWAPSGRSGTQLFDTDAGTTGDGQQYLLQASAGTQAMSWTFATSEDWGAIAAAFKEVPIVELGGFRWVPSRASRGYRQRRRP